MGGTGALSLALGALAALGITGASDHPAAHSQQATFNTVSPKLTCPQGMTLDRAAGRCKTLRTVSVSRAAVCQPGWVKVAGEFGGNVCQRKHTTTQQVGTRKVYSHTTVETVWVGTGRKRVQTGTTTEHVPAKTTVVPVVPPMKVTTGTTRVWVPPVTVTERVRTGTRTQRVRTCTNHPIHGRNCSWVSRQVPVYSNLERTITAGYWRTEPTYRWITSQTVTTPATTRTVPVYEWKETGYFERVSTRHYRTEPVFETRVRWETRSAVLAGCGPGWQQVGSRCTRTQLGEPSSPPTYECPPGMRLVSPTTCSKPPEKKQPPSQGDDEADDGGDDGDGLSLERLAELPDSRLSELGLHRCANGLLSPVPCDTLPEREWKVDPDACDGVEGSRPSELHGGTCVTDETVLTKCDVRTGKCGERTVRTFCPSIEQLVETRLLDWTETEQGREGETYEACVFDCSDFNSLPAYVAQRIQQTADYHCLPSAGTGDRPPDDEPEDEVEEEEEDEEEEEEEEKDEEEEEDDTEDEEEEDERDDEDDDKDGDDDRDEEGDDNNDDDDEREDDDDEEDDKDDTQTQQCAGQPSSAAAARVGSRLSFGSRVQLAAGPQTSLLVAPGSGWLRADSTLDVTEGDCTWEAQQVTVTWRELVPWSHANRIGRVAPHVLTHWRGLSAQQQATVRSTHRAASARATCSAAALQQAATSQPSGAPCGFRLAKPAVYGWSITVSYRLAEAPPTAPPANVAVRSGDTLVRSINEFGVGLI